MINFLKAEERGLTKIGWLSSRHSFSFGEFYDPSRMGWRGLRVLNDDHVEPGQGFGTHPHRDMEIISIVLAGQLEHKDSLGNGSILGPGEIQVMTAGSGITHSEWNPSSTEPVHFLQIWIQPTERGLAPTWEQKKLRKAEPLELAAAPEGGLTKINADARVYVGELAEGDSVTYETPRDRNTYIHIASGRLGAGTTVLGSGDAMQTTEFGPIYLRALEASLIIVFDLAAKG